MPIVNFSNDDGRLEVGTPTGNQYDREADRIAFNNRVLWVGIVGNTGDDYVTPRAPGARLMQLSLARTKTMEAQTRYNSNMIITVVVGKRVFVRL